MCCRCVVSSKVDDMVLQTFFISDPSASSPNKAARACNACYETVFPLLEPSAESLSSGDISGSADVVPQANSGSTLASFPSWKTTKLSGSALDVGPGALMPLDEEEIKSDLRAKRRMSSSARPLSYPSIPIIFQESNGSARRSVEAVFEDDILETSSVGPTSDREHVDVLPGSVPSSITSLPASSAQNFSLPEPEPFVNRKRFSMPAMAIQTTPVTARTNSQTRISGDYLNRRRSGTGSGASSPRFSLVLNGAGKRKSVSTAPQADIAAGLGVQNTDIGEGLAAARLNEILQRVKQIETD
jgi:hypothetical protein